jgi:energy-coupling factor transporter ATP-binding protein EcfA2
MIELENVTYHYPGATSPALRDVTLRIEQGEFVLVAGPSGAGKSTLLRTLNGLVPHFYGGHWEPIPREPSPTSSVLSFKTQRPRWLWMSSKTSWSSAWKILALIPA